MEHIRGPASARRPGYSPRVTMTRDLLEAQPPEPLHLSTVIPVYRGEAYLGPLVAQLAELRRRLADHACGIELREAVFVADAPADASLAVLARLASVHDWLRVLELSRNYGQHPATVAGILHTSGDWVATLDEDLQHPPQLLLPMLALAVADRRDVVFAKPRGAVHRSPFRNLTSWLAKDLLATASGNRFIRDFNSFRLLRGSVARAAAAACGHETYYDVALTWFTDRLTTLPMQLTDPRGADSGYGLLALVRHARRLLRSSGARVARSRPAFFIVDRSSDDVLTPHLARLGAVHRPA